VRKGTRVWCVRDGGSPPIVPPHAGGHSLPVYGEGWGGASREAAQLTHTSLVAVSQDAGEYMLSGIRQPAASATLSVRRESTPQRFGSSTNYS